MLPVLEDNRNLAYRANGDRRKGCFKLNLQVFEKHDTVVFQSNQSLVGCAARKVEDPAHRDTDTWAGPASCTYQRNGAAITAVTPGGATQVRADGGPARPRRTGPARDWPARVVQGAALFVTLAVSREVSQRSGEGRRGSGSARGRWGHLQRRCGPAWRRRGPGACRLGWLKG